MGETTKVKKKPSSKSYETVKKAIGDPFIVSKLRFFTYVTGLVEPFLTLFQTDSFYVPILKGFGIKAIRDNC